MLNKISQNNKGDVLGPSSSTDNAVPRFHLTTGDEIQGSNVTLNDDEFFIWPNAATGTLTSADYGFGRYNSPMWDELEFYSPTNTSIGFSIGASRRMVMTVGGLYSYGMLNMSTGANAWLWLNSTGAQIWRSQPDNYPALIINNNHPSSTGNIVDFHRVGVTMSSIDQTGAFVMPVAGTPVVIANNSISLNDQSDVAFNVAATHGFDFTVAGVRKMNLDTDIMKVSVDANFEKQLLFSRTPTAVSVSTSSNSIIYGVTDTSAPRTVTISTADVDDGKVFLIKDESGAAAANNITIATQGAETIDGAATITITANYGVARLYSDGTNLFTW